LFNTTLNGDKLRKLRLNKGLSQFELSVDCNLERCLISDLENNKRPAVSLCTAIKLATFFETTIEELLKTS
jgi:transcriptional regulator with XRE-family HTH domain